MTLWKALKLRNEKWLFGINPKAKD